VAEGAELVWYVPLSHLDATREAVVVEEPSSDDHQRPDA
jgi:hypothetical protein